MIYQNFPNTENLKPSDKIAAVNNLPEPGSYMLGLFRFEGKTFVRCAQSTKVLVQGFINEVREAGGSLNAIRVRAIGGALVEYNGNIEISLEPHYINSHFIGIGRSSLRVVLMQNLVRAVQTHYDNNLNEKQAAVSVLLASQDRCIITAGEQRNRQFSMRVIAPTTMREQYALSEEALPDIRSVHLRVVKPEGNA